MSKLRITAVSYLNTLPFVYGIRNSGLLENYDLQLDIPSECARKFIKKETDIALVPVAALKKINLSAGGQDSYKLLNEYCIGSNGKVRSVLLLSQVPLNTIRNIHLDYHSLTSVNLAKVLSKHFWKINPGWINLNEHTEINMTSMESVVAIGDKTFLLEKEFKYVYDLAAEWKKFSGLPFVFACWVADKNLPEERIKNFTDALEWGVLNKKKAVENLFDAKKFPSVNIEEYLEKNIDFIFNTKKHQALKLFLEYIDFMEK